MSTQTNSPDGKTQLPVIQKTPKKRGGAPVGRPRVNILPVLEVDLTKDPADLVLPCTESAQARALHWYVSEVRSINRILGLYDKLPMLCQAGACHWAKMCPTAPDFMFEGLRCPYEVMEVYRLFVRYVQEMEATPDKQVDLTQIMDLVRIDLQIHRIDQQIQVEGMMPLEGYAVVQSTGEEKKRKVSHPLLVAQAKLSERRDNLYKQLVATRENRRKFEIQEGKKTLDAMSIMTHLGKLVQDQNIINADYVVEDSPDFSALIKGDE